MTNHIEFTGYIFLFGVRAILRSTDAQALKVALDAYSAWDDSDYGQTISVTVVLKTYGVNESAGADASRIEGDKLSVTQGGISVCADGLCGKGICTFPRGAHAVADGNFGDMINLAVMFLIAWTGRIPIHASAVMIGDTAIALAGRSGSGKSTLALAASRASLSVLSDDTIMVQTTPRFRVWSMIRAIHVFEKDAPADMEGGLRLRSGRWKKALPVAAARHIAEKAQLCVLARGDTVRLEPMERADAVAHLEGMLEPGYDFYGARMTEALRALAEDGAWRLTLSADPAEAIKVLLRAFAPLLTS